MKLIELGKQIDCLNHERLEFENRINQSLQSLQYKEMEIQRLNMAILNDDDKHHHHHHQNDNNQQLIDQRISLLEIELAKEKERSKGLSLTLAKEKLKSLEKIKQNLEQHSSSPPQQQQKPLKKLHSSVDELKNEFQNFKMIFLHTYNNNNNNNNNNHDHHRHQHQHQQQHSS
ncbi:hypothetical protein DERF_009590 [Dermatophagoides farinae]|uniref:Uncharacterized protein n=1 Tax=Dermatophagoides farinae TaxID=6954 RepID=A0A922L5W6_DERFA|nr:hypothetical protein DERF_009590 [Dermatophagoides farinae]